MSYTRDDNRVQNMVEYTQYIPPKKQEIVIRVKPPLNPPTVPSEDNLKMMPFAGYTVATANAQGKLSFTPLAPLSSYVESGGRIHLGGAYYQSATGYLVAVKDGTIREFTNFIGKINAKEIEASASGERIERYVVSLKTADGLEIEIRVPVEEWCHVLDFIEKYAPQCQIYSDEIGNYRERFKRIAGFWLREKFPTKRRISYFGWGPWKDKLGRIFYHGGVPDCTSEKKLSPIVPQPQVSSSIRTAMQHILSAGPLDVTTPLLLYALASYTDAIFTDAGFPLAHCIMIIGESGFLKSSFSREIFSPFVPHSQRLFTVRSTEASLNVLHQMAFDDTLVIDDFNLEGSPAEVRQKMRNIRGLVRGYSDKTPRAKYGGADNITQYAMRGGCVFTAETSLTGQLKSGDLRLLKVFLHSPLEKTSIAFLHENYNIVPDFYSAYIHFLEANYATLVQFVKAQFPIRRADFSISEPRMKDAVIHLSLVADFIKMLLVHSGVSNENAAKLWYLQSVDIIHKLGTQQSCDAQTGEPYLRYLTEAWNLLGSNLKIAPDLHTYIKCIPAFVGYRENDLLIVKRDVLYKAVIDAFQARNEWLPIGVDEVSKKLKEAGLTKCDSGSCLIKASSKIPGRPRMLALIISRCINVIERSLKS